MQLGITMYARPGCEDSDMVREWLFERAIPFNEVNIDEDDEANHFVIRVNEGFRSTPTLVFGEEAFILVEPTPDELDGAANRAGYRPGQ
jgi:mycoredoxin